MDFNNPGQRIEIAFVATHKYLNYRIEVPPIIVREKNKQGGESITIGGGEIAPKELINVNVEVLGIIAVLSDMKDSIKYGLIELGKSKNDAKSMLDKHIVANKSLSLLTDFGNLKRHSKLDRKPWSGNIPSINNYRYEMITPLSFTFHSPKGCVYEADICDEKGRVICSFREMIEDGFEAWKHFILEHLPDYSEGIKARQLGKKNEEEKFKRFNEEKKKVDKLVGEKNNWEKIAFKELKSGMFIRVINVTSKVQKTIGFVSSDTSITGIKSSLKVTDIEFVHECSIRDSNEFVIEVFSTEKMEDFKIVNDYYWEICKMHLKERKNHV